MTDPRPTGAAAAPSRTAHDAGRRRALGAGVLTGAGVVLGVGAWAASPAQAQQGMPSAGSPMHVPDATLLDGGVFRAADAEGKVLVVYWWASWCPFCAQQSPHMQALWEREQGRGLRMLALSIDKSAEDARGYLARKGYTFPAALVVPEVQRVLPKPPGLPVTVVRGKDGRVAQAEKGQMFPEDVEALARWLG